MIALYTPRPFYYLLTNKYIYPLLRFVPMCLRSIWPMKKCYWQQDQIERASRAAKAALRNLDAFDKIIDRLEEVSGSHQPTNP